MGHFLELGKQALGLAKPEVDAEERFRIEEDARSSRVPAGITGGAPDPYADMVKSLLAYIQTRPGPQGMYEWLEKAEPKLYEKLDTYLPDEIHGLWTTSAPIDHFKEVLRQFRKTWEEAVDACWLAQLDHFDEDSSEK
jgi:hypothetical protein